VPENCDDTGFGVHAYGFGNPAGAFILGVIQGLWGLCRIEAGSCLRWRPALPDHWAEASMALADLRASILGTASERTYGCTRARPCRLRLELHCAANEEFALDSDDDGMTLRYEPHPCGRCCIIEQPAATEHRITVKLRTSPGLIVPPAQVDGPAVEIPLPPGDWSVEQAGEVISDIRIAERMLRGRLASGPQPAGFWLVERSAGRAFRVHGVELPIAPSAAEPPFPTGRMEHLDLTPCFNALCTTSFGK
ncbi:MAG: hypothetical protein HQL31_10035, partial [Planctomycetes bacterium]|nr:hypothetical protein [Planctomycetota bacterium]